MAIDPCPSSVTTPRGVVRFVPADFKVAFPEFATVADAMLSANFGFAELVLNNTCGSRVQNAAKRETLLNLLTAHITQLRNGMNGQAAGGLVGRVSDAAEGSDSVTADMGVTPYTLAWYNQTQYGATFLALTASYRTAVYIPAPAVCPDYLPPNFTGYGSGGCGC